MTKSFNFHVVGEMSYGNILITVKTEQLVHGSALYCSLYFSTCLKFSIIKKSQRKKDDRKIADEHVNFISGLSLENQ